MRYIGIDPGGSGGLVLLSESGRCLEAVAMPEAEAETWLLLSRWNHEAGIGGVRAAIEKVRASPQMSKGSIWTFAQGYGTLRGFLIAGGIPFDDVAPQVWQRWLGVRDKTGARPLEDVDVGEKKHRHKAKAEELFPSTRFTLKTADAALIAEYARLQAQGFGAKLPKS